LAFISHLRYTNYKKKLIADLELKLKSEENQLINDNKSYYLELAEQEEKTNKLKLNLPDYELNETTKKIIELENKVLNYKPKTNLMIAEYKKQLKKKNNQIGNITYSNKLYRMRARKT
jgi:inner membrane protein